jgi:hypothetical protein
VIKVVNNSILVTAQMKELGTKTYLSVLSGKTQTSVQRKLNCVILPVKDKGGVGISTGAAAMAIYNKYSSDKILRNVI